MLQSLKPKHIVLYADDDSDDLMFVQEAFAQLADNIEVISASDGAEALNYLENIKNADKYPCLIILDINMPRLNGKQTLKEIRRIDEFKNIPVVLFTTSSMPHDKVWAEQYQAGFITKPLDVKQMNIIADKFLSHCNEEIQRNVNRKFN